MTVLTTVPATDDSADGWPVHPTRASASGPVPYRALVVGGAGLIAGGRIGAGVARELAARTGHGVDVETVTDDAVRRLDAGDLLAGRDLSRIDAVVLALDVPAADAPGPQEVRAVLDSLSARLTVGAAVVVVLPADAGDELAAVVQHAADSLTPVVRLAPAPGVTDERRTERWAGAIGRATASVLIDPMVRFLPDDHHDEDVRLDAIDLLPPRDGVWVERFRRIVDEAREVYGTSSAALSIIDADHTRYATRLGFENEVIPRAQTICNRVLRTYGGLIVGDAQADLRFQRNPDVRSGDVRFYAGYRIESASGDPLGSLCVFDPRPREVDEADLIALRDLATSVQRTLWALQAESVA